MIKQSQVDGWDEEPVDERPSEFMPSTGHSVLSGYHPMNEPLQRQPARSRFSFKTLLLCCVAVLALGAVALFKLGPLLRA